MTLLKLLSVFLFYQMSQIDAGYTSYPIGGFFNKQNQNISRETFERIIQKDGTKPYYGRTIFSEDEDSYSAALELCPITMGSNSIVALIDTRPTNGVCDTVCLLCNKLNIPHLSLGWEPIETSGEDLYTFSYYPPPELISKGYAKLIEYLQWDRFTILYEDDSSFVRLQEIINLRPQDRDTIVFRQLDPEGDNKQTFKHILKVAHISYHIMDCDAGNVLKYMNEIVEVENSTEYLSFILTDLNSFRLNLSEVPELMANVSIMNLIIASKDRWTDIGVNADDATLEAALVADALNHMEQSIRKMQKSFEEGYATKPNNYQPPALCYNTEDKWELGNDLRQALLETTSKGFTGNIQFDAEGRRTNFTLHYYKLNSDSRFAYVGYWNTTAGVINKEKNDTSDRSSALKPNSKIRVATRLGLPYFHNQYPNGTFGQRGYAVDLIDKIFKVIKRKQGELAAGLDYEFYRVAGDSYGSQIAGTKKWNGLIGDLIEHRAQLAICDLTITSERNAVVDFSIPFMSLGISILFREPDKVEPDKFSFISPLALDVWLYLATTYIIVSFLLLLCARMSQDDWVNPHPCNQNPEKLENIWSLYNCMWLTMGAIMTQGCDILPRGVGSRWTAGMWWFFALIITASYTANMSTFLSNQRRSNDINDVKALSEQNKVSYGAVLNASTYKFFESSNDSVHQKIWSVMKSAKPTVFTHSNEEGRDRVVRSKTYAFFMESTAIEYYKQRNCQLKIVGPKLDSKEYGIAMPKNFPHKAWIDDAILSLQQDGELTALKKIWWEEQDNDQRCEEENEKEDDSGSLQMKNTSGIFLVLGFGGILGLIVAIVDFLLHARQIAVKEKVTFTEALTSEWRASLNPRQLHKPAAPPRSAAPSTRTPSPLRERSQSRAVSVLRAATSFINFDEIY